MCKCNIHTYKGGSRDLGMCVGEGGGRVVKVCVRGH